MKNHLYLLFLLLIFSCSRPNSNELPLFNQLVFELGPGESVAPLNERINQAYTGFFKQDSIQVPLYKSIHHADYQLFIGLPFETSVPDMIRDQLNPQDSSTLDIRSDSLSFYKKSHSGDVYLAEYAEAYPDGSLIYVSAISHSEKHRDSLFNATQLSQRIRSKK